MKDEARRDGMGYNWYRFVQSRPQVDRENAERMVFTQRRMLKEREGEERE